MSPLDGVVVTPSEPSQIINENEIELPKYISELKRLLKEDNVPVPSSDELLTRFIRARKFDVERACKSIKHFCNMRIKYHDLIQGVHPGSFEPMYHKHIASVFANRDSKGRQILCLRSRKWDPSDFSLLDGLVGVYITIEGMISYLETQLHGINIILDLKDLTFYQARQMNLKVIQAVVDIIQDTLPVSFQEIHIINHPMMFNMVWAVAKPLLKGKIRNRIHFHGYNLNSLHSFISPDILPYSLGGQLTNQEASDQAFFPRMLAQDEYYKEYLQFVVK